MSQKCPVLCLDLERSPEETVSPTVSAQRRKCGTFVQGWGQGRAHSHIHRIALEKTCRKRWRCGRCLWGGNWLPNASRVLFSVSSVLNPTNISACPFSPSPVTSGPRSWVPSLAEDSNEEVWVAHPGTARPAPPRETRSREHSPGPSPPPTEVTPDSTPLLLCPSQSPILSPSTAGLPPCPPRCESLQNRMLLT